MVDVTSERDWVFRKGKELIRHKNRKLEAANRTFFVMIVKMLFGLGVAHKMIVVVLKLHNGWQEQSPYHQNGNAISKKFEHKKHQVY